MEIQTSSTAKTYAPVGRCIYCGRTELLTREHIIPLGLGGNFVLPKASCPACAKMTNSFEAPLLRGYLYPARVHLGFPSRSRDPRPDAFPVCFEDGSEALVRLADHPCIINLPMFVEEPRILTGKPVTGAVEKGMWVYNFQEDLPRRTSKFKGRSFQPKVPMQANHFFRLLAKIGYAFAVAERGLDGFKPLILGIIQGETGYPDQFLGGVRDILDPKPDFHDLWLAEHEAEEGTFLVANVQLFASLRGPIYRVVVGQILPKITDSKSSRSITISAVDA